MWQGLGFSRAALGEISGIVECPCDTYQLALLGKYVFSVLRTTSQHFVTALSNILSTV